MTEKPNPDALTLKLENEIKEDCFMVNILKKLVEKVESGAVGVMEFTPDKMINDALDVVDYYLDYEVDKDELNYVSDVLNMPIREIADEDEPLKLELYRFGENRPPMLVEQEGLNKYKSFFHSKLCDIAGNAYRITANDTNAFYLIKVMAGNKESFELYLSSEYKIEFDGDDEYTVLKNVQPLCNDKTEELKFLLEKLYQASHDNIHQPKINDSMKAKLLSILE